MGGFAGAVWRTAKQFAKLGRNFERTFDPGSTIDAGVGRDWVKTGVFFAHVLWA